MKSNRGEGFLYWSQRGRGAQPLIFNAGISKDGSKVIISSSIEVNQTEADLARKFFSGADLAPTIERREYKKKGETEEAEETEQTESTEQEEVETAPAPAPTPAPAKGSPTALISALTKAGLKPTKDNVQALSEMVATGVSIPDGIALLKGTS